MHTKVSVQFGANAQLRWRVALYSLMNRADGRQRVWLWSVCCGQCFQQSGPWWWGYGISRQKLWTMNIGSFYWWKFGCPSCNSSTAIVSFCCMIMPMLQGSVHNSWKQKTSQFMHGLYTHQTCLVSMLGIGMDKYSTGQNKGLFFKINCSF